MDSKHDAVVQALKKSSYGKIRYMDLPNLPKFGETIPCIRVKPLFQKVVRDDADCSLQVNLDSSSFDKKCDNHDSSLQLSGISLNGSKTSVSRNASDDDELNRLNTSFSSSLNLSGRSNVRKNVSVKKQDKANAEKAILMIEVLDAQCRKERQRAVYFETQKRSEEYSQRRQDLEQKLVEISKNDVESVDDFQKELKESNVKIFKQIQDMKIDFPDFQIPSVVDEVEGKPVQVQKQPEIVAVASLPEPKTQVPTNSTNETATFTFPKPQSSTSLFGETNSSKQLASTTNSTSDSSATFTFPKPQSSTSLFGETNSSKPLASTTNSKSDSSTTFTFPKPQSSTSVFCETNSPFVKPQSTSILSQADSPKLPVEPKPVVTPISTHSSQPIISTPVTSSTTAKESVLKPIHSSQIVEIEKLSLHEYSKLSGEQIYLSYASRAKDIEEKSRIFKQNHPEKYREIRRAISSHLNNFSDVNAGKVLLEWIEKRQFVFRDQRHVLAENDFSLHSALDIAAFKFLDSVALNPLVTSVIAKVAAAIISKEPLFRVILFGKIFMSAPYVIPYFPTSTREEDVRKLSNDNVYTFAQLYFSIIQDNVLLDKLMPHIGYAWNFLSRFVTCEQLLKNDCGISSIAIIHTFLRYSIDRLLEFYNKPFEQILHLLKTVYLPQAARICSSSENEDDSIYKSNLELLLLEKFRS